MKAVPVTWIYFNEQDNYMGIELCAFPIASKMMYKTIEKGCLISRIRLRILAIHGAKTTKNHTTLVRFG